MDHAKNSGVQMIYWCIPAILSSSPSSSMFHLRTISNIALTGLGFLFFRLMVGCIRMFGSKKVVIIQARWGGARVAPGSTLPYVRSLSYRRTGAMQLAGRSGHPGTSRIRPAVGDQAGGTTEARNISPEKDDDWIKISQHVNRLNPSILKDATSALKREKWRGEGVQQAVFEQPCVNAVSSVSIACTSKTLIDRVQQLLSARQAGDREIRGPRVRVRVKHLPGDAEGMRGA